MLQFVAVALLSIILALALPHSFFEDWGWLSGPTAWLICALFTATVLALPRAPRTGVNGVAPGLVDTPLPADWPAAQQLWRERAPMRRAAQPEDVAQAVALLAASNYMTGEILLLDGGLNLT